MRYRRFLYVGLLIIAGGFPFMFIGCGGGGMSVPDLAPKKTGLSSNMLGLAMNDFFQKLKEGRKDLNSIKTYYMKLPDNSENPFDKQKWMGIIVNAYSAYQDYGMALYNYSAFKDGSPIDRPGYNEMAAKIARVGKEALPEMISAIQYTAMLKNTSFHKLKADELAIIYQRYVYHITKPFVEYPIDPLQELRTRKLAAEGLWDFGNIYKKGMSKGGRESQERLISYIGPYPYEMLIRECRWLLSLVPEHNLPEACSIVMEIESRLPKIERIAEEIWEKIGGRKGAEKLNERLLKKDLFHKREYILTRHFKRENKKLQTSEKEIQDFYSAFRREREEIKKKIRYKVWPGKDLPVKQGIDNDTLNNASTGPVGRSPVVVWESTVKIKRTEKGLVTWKQIRWAYTNIVVVWGETSDATQSYLAEYLTRPFTKDEYQRTDEITMPSDELGNLSYIQRYRKKNQRVELIGNVRFIRNNILIMIERYGMPAGKFMNLADTYDKIIQNQPEFKLEKNTYKDWFARIKKTDLSVKVKSSIPINLPSVPLENLQPFCLGLDTHSYIMEEDGNFTCHGWDPGQGKIAVGLVDKERGEIIRYEKITMDVKQ